jgi:pimeloyl-ACP methyl ester carboxylesterase
MLTTILALPLLAAFGFVTLRVADLREASIETRFPPLGRFVNVGGAEIHVVVKGEGPDLVLIHGAGGNARDFTFRFADRLAERFRVFAVDRPGLGWSGRADPGLNAAFTGDAESPAGQARILAEAVRRLGAERPLVLGHSYGGAVAMAWALEEEAAGLVILSGATMPWPGNLQSYYRVFGSAAGSALGAPLISAYVPESVVRDALAGVFAPHPVPEDYYAGAAVPLATRIDPFRASARQVKRLRPHLVEQSARYPALTLPVEIVHGTADTTVRAEFHADPLMKALPNARLTLLEGVGHAPHHVSPDAVEAAIDRAAERAGLR